MYPNDTTGTTPTTPTTGLVDTIRTTIDHHGMTVALVALAAITLVALIARRRHRPATTDQNRQDRADQLKTAAAALIATGMSAQGMWVVAGEAIHLSGLLRVGLFAFAEIALLAEANRARRYYLRHGGVGRHGAAVWVLASGAGLVSSMESDNLVGVVVRLAAPLVAAWLWHSGLISADQAPARRAASRITWRLTPQRVLVWLRLAEPGETTVDQADRDLRIMRLAKAAHRYHSLPRNAWSWRRRLAARRLHRLAETANRRLGLATDTFVQGLLVGQLNVLFRIEELTSPANLARTDAWSALPSTDHRPVVESTARPTVHPAGVVTDRSPAGRVPAVRSTTDRSTNTTVADRSTGTAPTGPTTDLVPVVNTDRPKPTTVHTDQEPTTGPRPIWSAASVANAAVLRERYPTGLPSSVRRVREEMGWSADRAKAAVQAYRAGQDLAEERTA